MAMYSVGWKRPGMLFAAASLSAGMLAAAQPAAAHPHVFVTVRTVVEMDGTKVTALRQSWSFDELYSTMAVEGLDTNKDGIYTREELAELTKANIDGLKDFDYFTFVRVGDTKIALKPPINGYTEFKDGVLSLNLTVPLDAPVDAGTQTILAQVGDPTMFISFVFAEKDPLGLSSGSPAQCKATLVVDKDVQQLSNAFGAQPEKTISVTCAK